MLNNIGVQPAYSPVLDSYLIYYLKIRPADPAPRHWAETAGSVGKVKERKQFMKLKSRRGYVNWNVFMTILLAAFLMVGCGGGSGGGGGGGNTGGGATVSGDVVDADGNAVTSIEGNDPVVMDVDGLDASTQYHIKVLDPNGDELNPSGGFVASTDEDGDLPQLTVIQDLGGLSTGTALYSQGIVARKAPTPGTHTIQILDENGAVVHTITFTVVDGAKVFAADSSGVARASFLPTEHVYAQVDQGDETIADGTYNLHVLSDLNPVLEDQDSLGQVTTTVTVSSGEGRADLGIYDSLGVYDIILDLDGDGLFDAGTDLISRRPRFHPAFTIQNANSGNVIVGQICADRHGNYRDIFDPSALDPSIRDMWGYITPSERSLVQHTIGVDKYVVSHQDTWSDGDTLTDVTGGRESDPVQGFCTNEAPWLIWPRELLQDGCYDCIIDVNHNGVFDVGTDFVDNIDNSGETTCGARVADSDCSDNITISSHTDNQTVTTTAIQLAGTVTGSPVSGQVTITSQTQSNTVNLTVLSGAFSAYVPLFNGTNQLTVAFVYSDDSVCSKTIDITSSSSSSANQLFRAQLTWDGDTDMDLHVVRPGGSYENGGGGADDCNYSNCDVGIDVVWPNDIDWGATGEDDDPKLDVDCIACGNGIENIWMNEIAEDGTYTIYVDAYNGSETNVTVTVFIRGAQVGQVNCGSMASGGDTDSCRVGTITWTGGNSGSGSFNADGSKASDF
jgi:uncharacterized protein YfaP (DUF2135 family)